MIAPDPGGGFDGLAARLEARARAIASAHAGRRLLSAPHRWREAGLLWPLFTKG